MRYTETRRPRQLFESMMEVCEQDQAVDVMEAIALLISWAILRPAVNKDPKATLSALRIRVDEELAQH